MEILHYNRDKPSINLHINAKTDNESLKLHSVDSTHYTLSNSFKQVEYNYFVDASSKSILLYNAFDQLIGKMELKSDMTLIVTMVTKHNDIKTIASIRQQNRKQYTLQCYGTKVKSFMLNGGIKDWSIVPFNGNTIAKAEKPLFRKGWYYWIDSSLEIEERITSLLTLFLAESGLSF